MASKKGTRKKSTSKKTNSHYPVVRSWPISAGASANTLVDGARHLSVINRRLMRFGRYYELKADLRPDYAGSAIEVFVLRDDWAVQKAFQMAYQQYLKNTADERKNLSSNQIARWEDFRVKDGLNLVGGVNQSRPVLHLENGGASPLNAGEFNDSNVVDGAGVERTFTWSGAPSATEYSLLVEYNKAGNQDRLPYLSEFDAPYDNINTQVDAVTHRNLQTDGNDPPYDETGVNHLTPWVRVAVLGTGGFGQQRLSTGFFTAPCGLVLLKGFTEASEAYSVTLEAKSGSYKGVHAPSMLE